MTDVAIVNRSTVKTDAAIAAVIPAVQAAVTEDFGPAWGVSATLHFVGLGQTVPFGMWPIYNMDTSDLLGAGGYHENTGNVPDGKVFVGDAMKYGISWTVDLTHELFEMLADPQTTRWVPVPGGGADQIIVEVGDPVEADGFGYLKQGVLISDFAMPAYFGLADGPHFDFIRQLNAPAPAMLPGGYTSYMKPDGSVYQRFARQTNGAISHRAARAGRLSRHGVLK